jgi:hypothetical protein
MMHDNLVPPSPLVLGGAGPSRQLLEPRDVLQARKESLDHQVGCGLRAASGGGSHRRSMAPAGPWHL